MAKMAQELLSALDGAEPQSDRLSPRALEIAGSLMSGVRESEMAKDPEGAPAMRPDVIALAEQIERHRPLPLRCTCGRRLGFLALGVYISGVLVMPGSSPVPPKQWQDRSRGPGSNSMSGWSVDLESRIGMGDLIAATWRGLGNRPPEEPDFGDYARRLTFTCESCKAVHPFRNLTLLRRFLRAIAHKEQEITLAHRLSTSARAS